MRLHAIPIVVMRAYPNVLENAGRMTQPPGVTVLSLPVDVETIRCVVDSVVRTA